MNKQTHEFPKRFPSEMMRIRRRDEGGSSDLKGRVDAVERSAAQACMNK
jgi:hypothetical protein